jgi:hypothetical protein
MSETREQSAIDAIYEILDKLEFLDKKVQVIDNNVKLLNNKIVKLSSGSSPKAIAPSSGPSAAAPQADDSSTQIDRVVLGKVKTFGYIVNKARQPLESVVVNIYDNKNKLIKNVKTNNDGYWEVRLPSGDYGVEYIHKKFMPINRTIKLAQDIREHEVR